VDLPTRLTRLAWLSIVAAVVTIGLKALAWRLTGSVGFLSDALESLVNLAAAIMALLVLRVATRPPDREHMYGHEKAEYLAAGAEGVLILLAAASIAWAAIGRLITPAALDTVGLGLALTAAASAVNLGVGLALVHAGRQHRSITLEADGRHLMTDVLTSVGVIAGVALAALTDVAALDPLVALAVAANIVATGARLVRRSTAGLMDAALPADERQAIERVLDGYRRREGVDFHAVRTRQAGRRCFVSLHVLVPGDWTVQGGHQLSERVDADLRALLPHASVMTHLEPREDPASLLDVELDRPAGHAADAADIIGP
jgi:cation diffusion facilitator family transporter